MKPIKIGIIGCGLIGQKRAKAALEVSHHVQIVADPNEERAAHLAGLTGATSSSRWQDVIASNVDVIIIATPHDQLAKLTLAAVEHHKHVLVEKPAARFASELRPVAEMAKKNGCLVKVGFNHRFHPAFQKAHEIFTTGTIGEIMYIRGRYGHGGRLGYEKEWRCQKDISGGGELVDQGSHLIDLSRWFMGDVALDYGYAPTYFWDTDVDDNCFLALRSPQGQMAWLHATWTEWKNTFSFEICGRHGKLHIEGLGGSYGTEKLTHYHMLPEMGPPETTAWEFPQADRSWDLEFQDFANAIVEKRQPLGHIGDALAMLEIIDAVYSKDVTA